MIKNNGLTRGLVAVALALMLMPGGSQKSSAQVFTVSGTQLLDANNQAFIIRGVNNPHIWFYKRALKALFRLEELKVNCVRIVWDSNGEPDKLDKVISRCITLGMIPMVELHNATGKNQTGKLMDMVAYYTRNDVKKVLLSHERYLLVNIANEWGDHSLTADNWKKSYMMAIDSLRLAGYSCTLVIDAPVWGQNLDPVLQYGYDLIEFDQKKNILFSVHMYYYWNDSGKIDSELQKAFNLNIPLIVGEFGYNYNQGNNNLRCKVDPEEVMKNCQELGYGYIAWSWTGNNDSNKWLDMSDPEDWKTLTSWGKTIVEGVNGITRTSKKASVFTHQQ